MKRKILLMSGEPIEYYGVTNVWYNMLSTFNLKNNFKVDVFTPYDTPNKPFKEFLTNNGGKFFEMRLPFKTGDNRFLLTKYVDNFFKEHNDYDVVHIHTGSTTTMYVFSKIAKKYGIKTVIAHVHGPHHKPSIKHKIIKFLYGFFIDKYVDYFFGCSKEAIDFKFPSRISRKAHIINNGIDIDTYRYNENIRKELREKYNVFNKFVIGNVGRLTEQKNVLYLIDIIEKLVNIDKNFVLCFVGDGDQLLEAKNKVLSLKLDKNVIFIDKNNEAYRYYNMFDVFVMPSIWEGLGFTAIEAQVNDLPCILSDRIPNLTYISTGTTYLPIDNVDLWANKIVEIKNSLNDGPRNNYKIDFDKFDRRKTYKFVEEVYKNG